MAPSQQALVSGMANENGVIESESLAVDADINIRQDDLRMFETETKRLLVRTDDLGDGVYLEAIPSPDGIMTEVVENPSSDLTEVTPADREEQEVESDHATTIEVNMD